MYVVTAIPTAENANAIRMQTGNAITIHHEPVIPSTAIVTRNAAEYTAPRNVEYPISPSAMSAVVIGVARIASYRWA
jgi:hypothetical protein